MRLRGHKAAQQKKFRLHRKDLRLPYAAPPAWGEFHVDPSVRTAAELIAGQEHHTAA